MRDAFAGLRLSDAGPGGAGAEESSSGSDQGESGDHGKSSMPEMAYAFKIQARSNSGECSS